MGSELYLARIVERQTVFEPPAELATDEFGVDFSRVLGKLQGRENHEPTTYEDFRRAFVSWAREHSAQESASSLGPMLHKPAIAAGLRNDPTKLDSFALGAVDSAWVGAALLSLAHPVEFPPIEALRISMQVLSTHDDAGLPREGSRSLRAFAVRLLNDAHEIPRRQSTPIAKHFGASFTLEGFGDLADDAIGVVPFAECERVELRSASSDTWMRNPRVRGGDDALVARITLVTFPAWVAELQTEPFASRAWGFD